MLNLYFKDDHFIFSLTDFNNNPKAVSSLLYMQAQNFGYEIYLSEININPEDKSFVCPIFDAQNGEFHFILFDDLDSIDPEEIKKNKGFA